MTRRRSTSPRRAIGASERHRSRQPIGRLARLPRARTCPAHQLRLVSSDERRAPDSPRRDSAQISVGRRHGARKPSEDCARSMRPPKFSMSRPGPSGGLSIPARYLCTDLVGRCAFPMPILRS